MQAKNAERNCPECGYSWRGLPGVGRCPECGFRYDGTTVVWRPPIRFLVFLFLLQAVLYGLAAHNSFTTSVPAGAILPPGVTPSMLNDHRGGYGYGIASAVSIVGAAVLLFGVNREYYVAVNSWGIRVHQWGKPRESKWAHIQSIKQGAFLCDWLYLDDGRRIRISRPMYNLAYSELIHKARSILAEHQAQSNNSRAPQSRNASLQN